jgi:hypothetical protein
MRLYGAPQRAIVLRCPHAQNRYRGPPMTLANMRANGVRSLSVTCEVCHLEALMNVDAFSDAVPVPAFGPRMVCTSCGLSVQTHGRIGSSDRRERA